MTTSGTATLTKFSAGDADAGFIHASLSTSGVLRLRLIADDGKATGFFSREEAEALRDFLTASLAR